MKSISLRRLTALRYVSPLREGGSLPGLMEADDDGLYVVKFRGAGQGPRALIAEVFLGEIARGLGLPVPEIVLVEVDQDLAAAEADPEIQELIRASAGLNMGIDFLPGAFAFAPPVEPQLAADIVWFDALAFNVDRTPKNPNLLRWHGRLWMIDHGAAMPSQHGDGPLSEAARNPFPLIANHVLLHFISSVRAAHERLAPLVTEALVREAVECVPREWFSNQAPDQYAEYILDRVNYGGFIDDIEKAAGQK